MFLFVVNIDLQMFFLGAFSVISVFGKMFHKQNNFLLIDFYLLIQQFLSIRTYFFHSTSTFTDSCTSQIYVHLPIVHENNRIWF